MKNAIVGAGYVGLSNAVLLTQQHEVVALDIAPARVAALNQKRSPIKNKKIEDYLAHKPLNPRATLDTNEAYEGADFVVIATSTNYVPDTDHFNTRSIEAAIRDIMAINPHTVMTIKSAVPGGYTAKLNQDRVGLRQHYLLARIPARRARPI